MSYKILAALALCFAILFLQGDVIAQTWQSLGGSAGVVHDAISPSLTVTNMPTTVRGVTYDNLDVYALWDDNSIKVSSCGPLKTGGAVCRWSAWTTVGQGQGFQSLFAPSVVSWGNNKEVFAVGNDLNLWYSKKTGNGTWSAWTMVPTNGLTTQLCSQPSVVVHGNPAIIDVFVSGCDANVWQTWSNNGWQTWQIPPGSFVVLNEPTALYDAGSQQLHVFGTDGAGNISDASFAIGTGPYDPTNALAWTDIIVPNVTSTLSVAAVFNTSNAGNMQFAVGKIGLFATGNAYFQNNLQLFGTQVFEYNYLTTAPHAVGFVGTTASQQPGGSLLSAVELSAAATNAVFYRNAAGQVAYQIWDGAAWHTPKTVGKASDIFAFDPQAAPSFAGTKAGKSAYVFAAREDGSIWFTYLSPK